MIPHPKIYFKWLIKTKFYVYFIKTFWSLYLLYIKKQIKYSKNCSVYYKNCIDITILSSYLKEYIGGRCKSFVNNLIILWDTLEDKIG